MNDLNNAGNQDPQQYVFRQPEKLEDLASPGAVAIATETLLVEEIPDPKEWGEVSGVYRFRRFEEPKIYADGVTDETLRQVSWKRLLNLLIVQRQEAACEVGVLYLHQKPDEEVARQVANRAFELQKETPANELPLYFPVTDTERLSGVNNVAYYWWSPELQVYVVGGPRADSTPRETFPAQLIDGGRDLVLRKFLLTNSSPEEAYQVFSTLYYLLRGSGAVISIQAELDRLLVTSSFDMNAFCTEHHIQNGDGYYRAAIAYMAAQSALQRFPPHREFIVEPPFVVDRIEADDLPIHALVPLAYAIEIYMQEIPTLLPDGQRVDLPVLGKHLLSFFSGLGGFETAGNVSVCANVLRAYKQEVSSLNQGNFPENVEGYIQTIVAQLQQIFSQIVNDFERYTKEKSLIDKSS